MRNPSLRTRLGAVFIGFLLLMLTLMTVTFWLIQTQKNDAAVINLAGRQRMLAQQMIHLAVTDPTNPELEGAIDRFDQTLKVLSQGGELVNSNGRSYTMAPTTNPAIHTQLNEIAVLWSAFQLYLQSPIDTLTIQTELTSLQAKLDDVVSAYEAEAQAKISRLRWVLFIFLAAALLLLAAGYRIIHSHLIQPLALLGTSAREIGFGQLSRPIPKLRGKELGQLAQTMETMRVEVAAAHVSLEQQVMQRTQELTAAFEFSQEIVREMDTTQLLQSVAQYTRDLMQGDVTAVCILDNDNQTLEMVASSEEDSRYVGIRQSTNRDMLYPVIHEHQTVITEEGCVNCGFLRHYPGASCVAAPLQVGRRSLGAICVVRPQAPFAPEEARAMTLLANAAAIALENARLIEIGRQQAKENASLAERERLAAELHDNLAQTLGAMHLSVDQLAYDMSSDESNRAHQRIAEIQANLKHAYTQVRMALTGLSQTLPHEGEFESAVRALLDEFETQSNLPTRLDMNDEDGGWLTAVAQKQALHIIREALSNIRRHAQATRVQIAIARENGSVAFLIADDGIGFKPDQVNSQNHLGLSIMRTRAERSYGQLTIESTVGLGTQIKVTFPAHSD